MKNLVPNIVGWQYTRLDVTEGLACISNSWISFSLMLYGLMLYNSLQILLFGPLRYKGMHFTNNHRALMYGC